MPYVIDITDGGIYQSPRRPAAEWLPQEQAKNLREALGGFLDDELEAVIRETGDIDSDYP